jgi:hypothetical protein
MATEVKAGEVVEEVKVDRIDIAPNKCPLDSEVYITFTLHFIHKCRLLILKTKFLVLTMFAIYLCS